MALTIGIDPGTHGAIAFLDGKKLLIHDMPLHDGKPNPYAIAQLLQQAPPITPVAIERAISTGIARVSMLAQGYNVGLCNGAAAALGMNIRTVMPLVWKRVLLVSSKELTEWDSNLKDLARRRATELFPKHSSLFQRIKDDGRAEAALLALWCAMT